MRKPVFSIYDSKGEFYTRPFVMQSKGQAVRAFVDLANDDTTDIGKHPEDYTLFCIAYFDELKGKYENTPTPESMGVAIEFKKPDRQLPLPEIPGPAK